jgi:hypothetical protein
MIAANGGHEVALRLDFCEPSDRARIGRAVEPSLDIACPHPIIACGGNFNSSVVRCSPALEAGQAIAAQNLALGADKTGIGELVLQGTIA